MGQSNKRWDRLTSEERQSMQQEIIDFFESERDEKIGVIAANTVLDFFLENVGSKIYNKGIADAKKALEHRMDELNYDLEDLMDD